MLSEALLRLYAHATPKEFPQRLAEAVHLLFPEAAVAIDEVFKQSGEVIHHFHDPILDKPEVWEAWTLYSHQHPGIQYVADGGQDPVLCLREMISKSDLHNLDFFHTVLAPINVHEELTFIVPASSGSILGISVALPKKASLRERRLADAVLPHLFQAQRNSVLVTPQPVLSYFGNELQFEIEVKRGNEIREWTSGARQLLDIFFARRVSHPWSPPADLLAWIERRRRAISDHEIDWRRLGPWILTNKRGRLHINFSLSQDSQVEILFLNGKLHSRLGQGSRSLTPREQQVVNWIVKGKSNGEIASILSIRTSTVKKHLENIFGKLGVENRNALTILALKSWLPG